MHWRIPLASPYRLNTKMAPLVLVESHLYLTQQWLCGDFGFSAEAARQSPRSILVSFSVDWLSAPAQIDPKLKGGSYPPHKIGGYPVVEGVSQKVYTY